jgi:hypothetical protein
MSHVVSRIIRWFYIKNFKVSPNVLFVREFPPRELRGTLVTYWNPLIHPNNRKFSPRLTFKLLISYNF